MTADNDRFRETFRGGTVTLTGTVASLDFYGELLTAIQTTQDFGNDEHTYGEVTVQGETFFWEITPGTKPHMLVGHISEYGI